MVGVLENTYLDSNECIEVASIDGFNARTFAFIISTKKSAVEKVTIEEIEFVIGEEAKRVVNIAGEFEDGKPWKEVSDLRSSDLYIIDGNEITFILPGTIDMLNNVNIKGLFDENIKPTLHTVYSKPDFKTLDETFYDFNVKYKLNDIKKRH